METQSKVDCVIVLTCSAAVAGICLIAALSVYYEGQSVGISDDVTVTTPSSFFMPVFSVFDGDEDKTLTLQEAIKAAGGFNLRKKREPSPYQDIDIERVINTG